MKRLLSFLFVLCFFLSSCALQDGSSAKTEELKQALSDSKSYPIYNYLKSDEQDIYAKVCYGINNYDSSVTFGPFSSEAECKSISDTLKTLYMQIVFEQSENFWTNPYYYEIQTTQLGDEYRLVLKFNYLIDKESLERDKSLFDKKIDSVISLAEKQSGDFEKVLFVYDYIMKNTVYDESVLSDDASASTGVNAYGCLIDGKTVCSGYALAFDAVLKRLGYECGVEFNNYNAFSIISGHVWNYCKLGEEYYYFDLTWDDTGYDSEEYKEYFEYAHNYFAITRDELSKSNFTLSSDAPTPPCNGKAYNYYIYKGYNVSSYSFDAVKKIIEKQSGQNYIEMRFDSYSELLRAKSELLDDGKIYDLVNESSISYSVDESKLHLIILL